MKKIEIKSIIVLAVLLLSIGFSSCTTEEDPLYTQKTLEEYRTEALTFINGEIVTATAVELGYNKGDFKATSTNTPLFVPYKTNYLAALNSAKASIEKADATIPQIVMAQSGVTATGKLFNGTRWNSDRRALNDLIVSLTALNTATVAGTAVGNAPQAAKDALTAAITAAKSVRDTTVSIQRLVDEAVVTLTAAKTSFEAAIIK